MSWCVNKQVWPQYQQKLIKGNSMETFNAFDQQIICENQCLFQALITVHFDNKFSNKVVDQIRQQEQRN